MRKLILILVGIVLFSCSNEKEQKLQIENNLEKAVNSLPYWHCGGGVYTNGTDTFQLIIREPDFQGAIMALDSFSETVYWYTIHWCSCNCERKNYEDFPIVLDFVEEISHEQFVSSKTDCHATLMMEDERGSIYTVNCSDGSKFLAFYWKSTGAVQLYKMSI